jgi:hypothetical protein
MLFVTSFTPHHDLNIVVSLGLDPVSCAMTIVIVTPFLFNLRPISPLFLLPCLLDKSLSIELRFIKEADKVYYWLSK